MRAVLLIFLFLFNELDAESVTQKKKKFYALVVPAVEKVYAQKYKTYEEIRQALENSKKKEKVEDLKKYYRVTSDQELLMALKPQPKSIAIAQAAMESGWGTSRFFQRANNLFGMWSISKKEKRIAAMGKRDNNRTIWIKKYDSIEDSIKGYYLTLSRGKQYEKMRRLNYKSDDVYEIIKGLEKYSERGKLYVDDIAGIIRYNKLTQYDER
ncbi:MAG: glucosaminidase domain-containing protein [Sulfurimonas sp.]